ncbi:MAG: M67 family metallopeptidase [Novosphingobium sp.]|uniref:Mov34/MPN/PAD-1 family protein n=1 Tax=Novosphingobium sp. TaxID=1874826 RepID=UPI003C7C8CD3
MDLMVTSGTIATLIAEAQRAHPRECCGLLLGQAGRVALAQPAANVHPYPLRHFEIDPQALIAAHRAARAGGLELLGYYHSHPNGLARPSQTDAAQASGDGRAWAIVAAGEVSWWRDAPNGFEPLPTRLADG